MIEERTSRNIIIIIKRKDVKIKYLERIKERGGNS
jgi:hypothetical protein